MTARLEKQYLEATFYLYPDEPSAADGCSAGGTGFFIGVPVAGVPDLGMLWAITNKHVIENGAWTLRINKRSGGVAFIDTDDTQWICDPEHDLAVMPINLSSDLHEFSWIRYDWLLTKDLAEVLDIGPGDPCFTIGRFVRHDGRVRNTPTARFGQIAQGCEEPLDGQESYLVEVRSIGGFSGAPVFVWLDIAHGRSSIVGKVGPDGIIMENIPGGYPSGPWLLGVNWCMIPAWEPVCDVNKNPVNAEWQVPANTGMMGVVPSWHLLNMFEAGAAMAKKMEIQTILAAKSQIKTARDVNMGDSISR